MKRMLLGFVALALLLASQSQATAAPVVFDATGVFSDYSGYLLTGTVTIDTATGEVLSIDLAVTTAKGKDVAIFSEANPYTFVDGNGNTNMEMGSLYGNYLLVILIPFPSLVNYEGGDILSDLESSYFIDSTIGSLEPAAPKKKR